MQLSRLVLFGFKSFAERVEITFGSGLTAIVGPNGCGKSNIADAIRWALGEQSARLLRGDRMEEVIFAGSQQRKPLGMAEVSLVFTDNAGDIPTEFSEVTVTRRLYRSGESEYLLNHAPCRLRDITELFLDTGLGGEPYALIEQGSVGAVVNYKIRKKAALVKLDSAEQNLVRVGDILREIERQRNSLARQARKAERYLAFQERARQLKAVVRFHEGQRLRDDLKTAEQAEQAARWEVEAAQAGLASCEAELETSQATRLEQEEARAACQGRLHQVSSRRSHNEAELGRLRQMREEWDAQRTERRDTAARVQERQSALAIERAAKQEEVGRVLEEIAAATQHVSRHSLALQGLVGAIGEKARLLEDGRRRLLHESAALAERRHHLSSLRERERLYGKQRDAAVERRESLIRQDGELATREEEHQRLLDRILEEVAQLRRERDGLAQQEASEATSRDALRAELDAMKEELHRLESRLASLVELSATFEGYAAGNRCLLEQKAENEPRVTGVRAPLAELIETPARYERAIEALLGDVLQGLIMQREEDARLAIEVLHERGAGRATLLLPPRQEPPADVAATGLRDRLDTLVSGAVRDGAVCGLAIDLIGCADSERPLVRALLADAIVVEELSDALSLIGHLRIPCAVATLRGELVTSRGVVTGGPAGNGGLLARRREVAELREFVRRQDEQVRALDAVWDASCRRSAQLAESLELLAHRLREVETDRLKIERDLSLTRGERRRVAQQIEVLTYESKSHAEDLRVLTEEIVRVEATLEEDEERLGLVEVEANALQDELALLHQQRHDLTQEEAERRVQLASLEGRRELLASGLAALEEEADRVTAELNRLGLELEQLHAKATDAEATILELQGQLGALIEQERAARRAVEEQDDARQRLTEQRESLEARRRDHRQSLASSQELLHAATIRRTEVRSALHHFEAMLVEEGLSAPEMTPAPLAEAGLDVDAARRELDDVTTRIADLGGVNLAAAEEYQALEERRRFLTVQAEDLNASVRSLRETIVEINRTIQTRFNETLETVNGHLDRLWKRLFSGGEVALRPVGPESGQEDPGLDLSIRIPGKRAQLHQLSGGEKALAALALLLALFQTRPSPFCLLDEVDAPLDDANIDRFASLLRELSDGAQFIVITHNKRTMEAADMIYGVTMEEQGISRLLSLRLEQAA
jgi:chromosome segregation protein